jgi:ribA/ribD-fused uncharacterized protein
MSNDAIILAFRGQYRFLSNSHQKPIKVVGEWFPTVEHAYLASLLAYSEPHLIEKVKTLTPGAAKKWSDKYQEPPGWGRKKRQVMLDLIRQKFSPGSDLAKRLVATGSVPIINGKFTNNPYWGVQLDGSGLDWVGRILMHVREELKDGRKYPIDRPKAIPSAAFEKYVKAE